MSDFRFHDPLALVLLLVPLMVGLWRMARRRQRAAVYSSATLLEGLPMTARGLLAELSPWLQVAGLLLIVVAAARPQQGLREFRARAEGIAIAICLDRSGSMQALDFRLRGRPVNRLEAVKQVVRDFVLGGESLAGRPDDQISLIAFGGFAEDKTPLTFDHESLVRQLDAIEIPQPVLDERGRVLNERLLEQEMATAIGDAVALGVDRLKESQAKSRVLILLSDGENTAGAVSPREAAQAAQEFGIKIYTIGVGRTGLAPFPVTDAFGRRRIARRQVRLDEATLQMLAATTGGKYFHAQTAEALEDVYASIDDLEKTAQEGRLYTEYNELYAQWLVPGLVLIVLDRLLRWTWLRSLP